MRGNRCFKDCVCKPVADYAGRGIFSMTIHDGLIRIDNQVVDRHALGDYFTGSQYVIQEKIIQHERMSRLHPASVNTIRLVTCFVGDVVRPFSAFLRIGTGGRIVDNWSMGGILVYLDTEKGCLGKDGFIKPEYGGRKYDRASGYGSRF